MSAITEELGLELPVGRMLVMGWQGPEPGRTESLMFIYGGGVPRHGGDRVSGSLAAGGTPVDPRLPRLQRQDVRRRGPGVEVAEQQR